MSRNGLAVAVVAAALCLAGPLAAQQFENVPQAQPATQQPAAAGNSTRIGVVNIRAALLSTQEGKKAMEDLQAQFAPKQAQLQKLGDEIRDMDTQLRTQERTLSDDARAQLLRQLEVKRKQATRMQQDFQDEAEDMQNQTLGRIADKMQQVIGKYASDNNIAMVLNGVHWADGGAFIYAAPTVDITSDVVKLYDTTYPVQAGAAGTGTSPPAARGNQPPPRKPNQ
ncbi:MAG: OmpH family outer membrane protein [Candidatus Acidiferrales bacterium]